VRSVGKRGNINAEDDVRNARAMVATMLEPLGLRESAERFYWRLSPRWNMDTELVRPSDLRPVLGRVIAAQRWRRPDQAFGDYLEFGVYNGRSLGCTFHALEEAGLRDSRLIGFDSFEGMPGGAGCDEAAVLKGGSLYFDEASARANLRRDGVDLSRVVLVKGWFEDTLTDATIAGLGLETVGLVMIDCVIYSSTATVLRFIEPLIRDETVVIFDDWTRRNGHLAGNGQKRALDELLAAHEDLRAEEIDSYAPHAKVFRLSRAR
jgi:O-methyltransferase